MSVVTHPATAAERTRASRQRQKDGEVLVSIAIPAALIARLITLGWLAEDQQHDRAAIAAALWAFIRRGWGVSASSLAELYRPVLAPPEQ